MAKKIFFGAFVFVFSFSLTFVSAQEVQQDQQAMMEAYMKMMIPNENHGYLKNFVGDWDATSTAFYLLSGPPSEPENRAKRKKLIRLTAGT